MLYVSAQDFVGHFPAELTSMFALPAADIRVRRAHSNLHFNMSISLRCTSRLSQQQNSTPCFKKIPEYAWNYFILL